MENSVYKNAHNKMLRRKKKNPEKKIFTEDKIFDYVVNFLVLCIAIITIYPIYYVILASISSPSALINGKTLLFPADIDFNSYKYILEDKRVWTGYLNTIIYTLGNTLIGTTITILAGYALSRKDLVGHKVFMKIAVFTMYFQGGLIPTYMVVKNLGLVNTRYILMIIGSFTVFNMIVTRTFFISKIPDELHEAAQLDGCGNGKFFLSVVFPLSKEIIAVIVLYIATASWNSFFNAMIYITESNLYPLQLVLREVLLAGQTVQTDVDAADIAEMQRLAATIKYSIMVISIIPILTLYPFVQKYFVKGVMVGSIKG